MSGDSIFKAPRPAGVGRNISSDTTVFEACGIRGVKEFLFFGGGLEDACDHAWLDHRDGIGKVNFLDLVHPSEGKGDATLDGDAAPDVAKSRAPWGDGDLVTIGEFKYPADIVRRFCKDHDIRVLAGKPLIGSVGSDGGGITGHAIFSEDAGELGGEVHSGGFSLAFPLMIF